MWEDTNKMSDKDNDPINPNHYISNLSGVECIDFCEEFDFCLGNALKYLWRCEEKDTATENLRKAVWYIERELFINENKHLLFSKPSMYDYLERVTEEMSSNVGNAFTIICSLHKTDCVEHALKVAIGLLENDILRRELES